MPILTPRNIRGVFEKLYCRRGERGGGEKRKSGQNPPTHTFLAKGPSQDLGRLLDPWLGGGAGAGLGLGPGQGPGQGIGEEVFEEKEVCLLCFDKRAYPSCFSGDDGGRCGAARGRGRERGGGGGFGPGRERGEEEAPLPSSSPFFSISTHTPFSRGRELPHSIGKLSLSLSPSPPLLNRSEWQLSWTVRKDLLGAAYLSGPDCDAGSGGQASSVR